MEHSDIQSYFYSLGLNKEEKCCHISHSAKLSPGEDLYMDQSQSRTALTTNHKAEQHNIKVGPRGSTLHYGRCDNTFPLCRAPTNKNMTEYHYVSKFGPAYSYIYLNSISKHPVGQEERVEEVDGQEPEVGQPLEQPFRRGVANLRDLAVVQHPTEADVHVVFEQRGITLDKLGNHSGACVGDGVVVQVVKMDIVHALKVNKSL